MDRNAFLKLLFDKNQQTCFAATPYDTAISIEPAPDSLWFSINAMHTSRADANVECFRNFLIEIDSVPLNIQIDLVRSKMPVSSIVYSGGKSYHFLVSLQDALPNEAEYRRVARGLLEAVPEADKSTKNPSRLSRLPGVVRPDTGLIQDLVYLGSRVPLAELPKPAPYHEPTAKPVDVVFNSQLLLQVLHVGVDNYVSQHFSGGRNRFFYWLGRRCSELSYTKSQKKATVDKYYAKLQNKKNFSITEAYSAARVKF